MSKSRPLRTRTFQIGTATAVVLVLAGALSGCGAQTPSASTKPAEAVPSLIDAYVAAVNSADASALKGITAGDSDDVASIKAYGRLGWHDAKIVDISANEAPRNWLVLWSAVRKGSSAPVRFFSGAYTHDGHWFLDVHAPIPLPKS